ncbi:MarR family transcriptional regulator [Stakelama marina]|uniref:Winged helix-turn-helix transcriptional regulator n=1 Tax=Stakelama marina TaxID=2826939 RepID=A0A8T4IKK7_9SPHN|nr:MarR family transcriptional regulator [Stakelama marina]MBR0553645.1 winged helix-turn-helix transcriptional regulator [Stakelama marina]
MLKDEISPAVRARLMNLVTQVTDREACSSEEAVDRIEAALDMSGESAPVLRSLGDFAQVIRTIRLRRNETLGVDLMRDPAWDMLLDLFSWTIAGHEVTTKTLCAGSGVPPTTALRHLQRLEEKGVIERHPNAFDQRCMNVTLAPPYVERLASLIRKYRDACVEQ